MSATVIRLPTAQELTYVRLMNRLRAEEPNSGYPTPESIGELSLSDIATVLHHEPTVLADACCDEQLVTSIRDYLGQPELPIVHVSAFVGVKLLTALAHQVRRYLWLDFESKTQKLEAERA